MPRFVSDSRPTSAQHPLTEFYRQEFLKHQQCLQRQRPYFSESAINTPVFRFENLGAVAQHIKAGKLKALAVTGDKRPAALPDVPTAAEAGIADVVVYSWQPRRRPKDCPQTCGPNLKSEIAAAMNSPDVKKQFNDIGFDVLASNGAQFAEFLADETQRWRKVVEAGDITAE